MTSPAPEIGTVAGSVRLGLFGASRVRETGQAPYWLASVLAAPSTIFYLVPRAIDPRGQGQGPNSRKPDRSMLDMYRESCVIGLAKATSCTTTDRESHLSAIAVNAASWRLK